MHAGADDPVDSDDAGPPGEQDLLVVVKLRGRGTGSAEEQLQIDELEEQLDEALADGSVGEYDGCEYASGSCTLFFAGPEVDRLFERIRPVLKRSEICRGAEVVRQYGDGGPNRSTRL